MQRRRLGTTGLTVSEICLGTMTFGSHADEATSLQILNHAFDAGIDFLDAAEVYPVPPKPEYAGQSEVIISLSIGLLLGLTGASQLLSARLLPRLLRRIAERELLLVGGCLMAVAYLISAWAPSFTSMINCPTDMPPKNTLRISCRSLTCAGPSSLAIVPIDIATSEVVSATRATNSASESGFRIMGAGRTT